jgi:hypothetical protein
MRTARDGANELCRALRGEGGTIAAVLRELPPAGGRQDADPHSGHGLDLDLDRPGPAQIAASGPRTAGHEREYELLLEMILEGARLHYGRPLVVWPEDPDLGLLLGDQLYALGLSRLAALGDLEAIAELADVISIVSQAHAAGDPDLAAATWEAGAVAIGWGGSRAHAAAKALARAQDPGATEALRAGARGARRPVGSTAS